MKVNIVPMAGEGSRFLKAGFPGPKPLISVKGKPMVLRAVEKMPAADRWIFIVRQEHVNKGGIDAVIKSAIKGAVIVPVGRTTAGGIATALLAGPNMESDDPAFISACDIAPEWDEAGFWKMVEEEKPDAVVFTFEGDADKFGNASKYSWVKSSAGGRVEQISLKKPVRKGLGSAIVGSFYFSSWSGFRKAAQGAVEKWDGERELHLEGVVNGMIAEGKKVLEFKVKRFVCFGTPEELEAYLKGN